jgi:hypothetical protein
MLKRINTFGSIALILIFAAVSFSQLNNSHSHIVNGVMISHAHPYEHSSNSPLQDHEHSSGDFSLLAFFKDFHHFTITISDNSFAISYYSLAFRTSLTDVNQQPINISLEGFYFRGPPRDLNIA